MYYVYVLHSDVDILGDLGADYCPELASIIPRETGDYACANKLHTLLYGLLLKIDDRFRR
jgi:hypothetical protein